MSVYHLVISGLELACPTTISMMSAGSKEIQGPGPSAVPKAEADRVTVSRTELEGLVASAVQRVLEQRAPDTGNGKR